MVHTEDSVRQLPWETALSGTHVKHINLDSIAQVRDMLQEEIPRIRGAAHYEQMPVQPVDYIVKNDLTFLEGNVVKYVSRHRAKNGAEDIEKAIHYCELILKHIYGRG